MSCKWLPCFIIDQLLSVAVIRCDQQAATDRECGFYNASNAAIDRLDPFDCCLDYASVTNHIGVGIVHYHQVVIPSMDMLQRGIGDAFRAHLRLQIICLLYTSDAAD